MNHENLPMHETYNNEWFMNESLRLLADQLTERTYPDYPTKDMRLYTDSLDWFFEPITLPMGDWETSCGALPTLPEQAELIANGCRMDANGRPLHPWFDEMITDSRVGIVTGKGKYWHWGPNYTADPIVVRYDQTEPHILLIERADGTGWALPGGFVDAGEDGITAALREAHEETGFDLTDMQPVATVTYEGPLADLRVTAHAWPETTAVKFELPNSVAAYLPLGTWQGKDDAKTAGWFPVSELNEHLFGSHLLLITQALAAA